MSQHSKEINFLTASGQAMWDAFVSLTGSTDVRKVAEHVRDQTRAAAEAKVRGECKRACVGVDPEYKAAYERVVPLLDSERRANLDLKARAERAEAEREDFRSRYEFHYEARLAAEAALADAKREGAAQAVRECRAAYDRWNESGSTNDASLAHDLTALGNKYAPTPARSVTEVNVEVTQDGDGLLVTITPEQARAIVALAGGTDA